MKEEQVKAGSALIGIMVMVKGLNTISKNLMCKVGPFEVLSTEDLNEIRDVIQKGISDIFSPKTDEEELEIMVNIVKEILSKK